MELTILMPCLNEAKTLANCVRQAQAFIALSNIQGEVLIADNGSTDGSQGIAMAEGARVVAVSERGYGAALIAGINAANGRYVIMGDSDESYDFGSLELFMDALRQGNQLVMGNRFKGGIAPGAMPTLHRYLGNPVLSFIGRLFFSIPIGDFHCGLRGFSTNAIRDLKLMSPGMEFASEMVAKSALADLLITEVPTTLKPDGRGRPPHLRTWRDGWRHLRFMLLFCPRWLFLYPGLAMLMAGIAGFIFLSHGPLTLRNVGLDIHSLLYMAATVVLGSQMVQFAILIKWFGTLVGLVPAQPWLQTFVRYVSIELGILSGALLFAIGVGWSADLIWQWREAGFGALNPVQTMRSAIPAVTLMILGVQLATTSLFTGAIGYFWASGSERLARAQS